MDQGEANMTREAFILDAIVPDIAEFSFLAEASSANIVKLRLIRKDSSPVKPIEFKIGEIHLSREDIDALQELLEGVEG
jgi:hypothetical protein